MASNERPSLRHINSLRYDNGISLTVEVKIHQGLWMVLFGGREEARCRDRKDASDIGRDIATRTRSVFVLEADPTLTALTGI
jgi:hypothetical protein